MSKFYIGQRVLVTRNSYYEDTNTCSAECVGEVCKVRSVSNGNVGVYTPDECDWWYFNPSDLQPINETPETLTINGVEYTRKPEPVVEHEWKFGDVATHKEHGVGIVTRINGSGAKSIYFDRPIGNTGDGGWLEPSSLTLIRRADLSV